MGAETFRFGEFELDGLRQQLRCSGRAVEIQPRPLRLLLHLVEHRERMVPKEELFDVLWPGTAVSDGALSTVVYEVRQALGDTHSAQRWIRTARGRGFQFVGDVEECAAAIPPGVPEPRSWPGRWIRSGPAAATLLLAVGAAAWALWPQTSPAPGPSPTSLLVLPFENLNRDDELTWLASGMAEELIDTLARVPQLEIKARTSGEVARRMGWDIPEIAQRAGVSKVIDGSVRHEKGRVRVAVQLIDAATGFHLWSHSYDRPAIEILDLQREIATAVAGALEVPLEIHRRATDSVEAWEAYRLGQGMFWTDGPFAHPTSRLLRALEHLERAAEIDPAFAAVHAAIASASGFLCRNGRVECDVIAQPRAWAALDRALALDPELSAAHTARAFLLADRWDWSGAEAAARRAMEVGHPGSVHPLLPHLLLARGEIDEALELLARAELRDPASVATSHMGVIARDVAGIDLERALVLAERIGELSPGHPGSMTWRFMALSLLGREKQALETFMESPGFGFPEHARQEIRQAYRTGGWLGFYRVTRDRIHRATLGPHRWPCRRTGLGANVAVIHVRAGDLEGALDCLEALHDSHGLSAFIQLGTSWIWDPLRDDPRFQAILEDMGLAEMSAEALPRVRAYRDCSGPSPSEIRCTDLKPREVASR